MGAKNQVCAQSSTCEGGEKQVGLSNKQVWAQRSRCGHIEQVWAQRRVSLQVVGRFGSVLCKVRLGPSMINNKDVIA